MVKRKKSRRKHDTQNSSSSRPNSAPEGAQWIYGQHAVYAALGNPQRHTIRLIATPEAKNRLREFFPSLKPENANRDTLDSLLPEHAVHQGIALLATTLQAIALEDLLIDLASQAIIVVLDQVTDPHNVGAVLRSAAAFGAIGVIVQSRSAPPSIGALSKAASGALDILPLVQVTNLARALTQIEAAGFWRIGFDGGATQTIEEAPLNGRVALILGAEGSGLRRLTREACDHLVRISAPGKLKTLNISNAAAVALYETVRRQTAEKQP
jgi:23S rRNA (guanosine2251-2'-O)-methyltransferase